MSGEAWLEGMRRLHQRADRLGNLAGGLTRAIPQRSDGCDPTGWVSAIIDQTGSPVEVRVRGAWEHRLEPGELGPAVMAAFGDAVQRATRAWADRLDDEQWWRRQRDAEQTPADGLVSDSAFLSSGRVHDDLEFSEPVLRALHSAGGQSVRVAEQVVGVSGGHDVVIRLVAGGLAGCEIDPDWARPRDGATITAALGVALASARQQLVETVTAPDPAVDAALHDAWATLTALTSELPKRGDW